MRRVALVHDWLTGMRGGERCLLALLELFPDAEIFTLLHRPGSVAPEIARRPIHESFVGRMPFAARAYRYYLPIFPRAIERFDFRGFDLVISISHCVAKGARVPEGTTHVSYCLTPMRYVWDQFDAYFGPGRARWPVRGAMLGLRPWLRRWDVRTAGRVNAFVAASRHVAARIARAFDRDARVIYPPVDVDAFTGLERASEDFYLIVSALVPYKRVDLAVDAFAELRRPLVVVGDGPDLARLRRHAPPNVTFTGRLSDAEVADRYRRCRALVFPGEEDFGITAVEAQAAGAPVIAYGRGGVTESVVPPDAGRAATGIFFESPSARELARAVRRFERMEFDPAAARRNARRFASSRFTDAFAALVRSLADPLGDADATIATSRGAA